MKHRRFAEGGNVTTEDLAAANASSDPIRELNRRKGWTKDSEEPKNISFGEAFRSARDAGLKQFSFGGKKFTTELASEKKAKPAVKSVESTASKSKPQSDSYESRVSRIPGGDSESKAPSKPKDSDWDTMVKSGNPLVNRLDEFKTKYGRDIQNTLNAIGGAGRLGVALGRGSKAAPALSSSRELAIPETAVKFAGRSEPRLMNAKRIGMDAEEVGTDMVPAMKRGGKVKTYAKGGSVSSASKRADGCAAKGKTKGRMY